MPYGHDVARELRVVGFNLDKRAQAIGVSHDDWVAVAQDRGYKLGSIQNQILPGEYSISIQILLSRISVTVGERLGR